MGWFFRRSVRVGPFRLNLSKSGIGVSAGVRGARVSTGPKGTYVNLGVNGVYFRQKIGGAYPESSVVGAVNIPSHGGSTPLPAGFNYPSFPKHGLPRIVTTLAYLSIPILIISLWILAVVSNRTGSTNSTVFEANHNSSPITDKVTDRSIESARYRGFQAGFDYGLREARARNRKRVDQRRLKNLAVQLSQREQERQDWEQGWVEGYTKGFDSLNTVNLNHNRPRRSEVPLQETEPESFQQVRPSASRGYIRGPRGGCYYISGSGRKVYVDRGLCN